MMSVYVLDVGQGDCSVVIPPRGCPILFDCADANVAWHFMWDQGIRRLSAVVASHLDLDHIGGMLCFLAEFLAAGGRVDEVYLDHEQSGHHERREAALLTEQLLKWRRPYRLKLFRPGSGAKVVTLASGWTFANGLGRTWGVQLLRPLHSGGTGKPKPTGKKDSNLTCAVLRVAHGDSSMLIGADTPLSSWEQLDESLLRSRVFRIPHHGGHLGSGRQDPPLTRAGLYEKAGARVAICSAGNRFGHPYTEHLLDARRNGQCRVMCTQLKSACHGLQGTQRQALREEMLLKCHEVFHPFRHEDCEPDGLFTRRPPRTRDEIPCAGTILVELDPRGRVRVTPSDERKDWHRQAVDGLSHPVCRMPCGPASRAAR